MALKAKIISVFTAGVMMLTAISGGFEVFAEQAFNPLGLTMTAEKTWFSPDEIREGQTVTVYVDPVGEVLASDQVGSLQFGIISDAWGFVDPVDLMLCSENALATESGYNIKQDKNINQFASMSASVWDETEKPKKPGYILFDYASFPDFTGYSDEFYYPTVTIMSDSAHGFF